MVDRTECSVKGGSRIREGLRPARPLISIVVVVYRARNELRDLLESIFALRDDSVETVVIDGGSQDGTLDLLREWDHRIDYWISERDEGIYDAMNKGVAASSGEYILHLNAGDLLRYIPLQELTLGLADHIDVACFAVEMKGFGIHRPRAGVLMRFTNPWHHQGTFYRRSGHLGYDTQYRIYGDFDLNQRMMKAGKVVRIFKVVVAEQATVGVSGDRSTYNEQYRLIRNNFGFIYVCLAFFWLRFSRLIPSLKRLAGA